MLYHQERPRQRSLPFLSHPLAPWPTQNEQRSEIRLNEPNKLSSTEEVLKEAKKSIKGAYAVKQLRSPCPKPTGQRYSADSTHPSRIQSTPTRLPNRDSGRSTYTPCPTGPPGGQLEPYPLDLPGVSKDNS